MDVRVGFPMHVEQAKRDEDLNGWRSYRIILIIILIIIKVLRMGKN